MNLIFKKISHSKLFLPLTIGFELTLFIFFVITPPTPIFAQASPNPWSVYNNPSYGNSLDTSLGTTPVDPPATRLHSGGNLLVKNNVIIGTGAVNSLTWGAKSIVLNSATTPWWVRGNASDTQLAFGTSTDTSDTNIRFYIDNSGNVGLPRNGSFLYLPEISGNTAVTGIAAANGNMSDGVPYYGAYVREPGSWTSPFPDYVLNNHTGLRLAAHGGYGGVSIYEELNPANTAWSSTGNEVARFRDNRYGGSYFNSNLTINSNLNIGGTQIGVENAYYMKQIGSQPSYTGTRYYLGNGSSSGYVYGDTSGFGLLHSGGGWAISIPPGSSGFSSSRMTDLDNGGYYLDPNGTSNLYAAYRYYGFNGPEYDGNNGGYYVDPNGNSHFANGHFDAALINWPGYNGITEAYGHYLWPGRLDGSGANYQQSWYLASHSSYGLYSNTGLYLGSNLWAPHWYDSNNSAYYVDPAGRSRQNDTWYDYISCMSSWCPNSMVMRLTPNLHLNAVGGYATIVNWDNGGYSGGSISFAVGTGNADCWCFYVTSNGSVYSAQYGWLASDERLKENIHSLSEPVEKLKKLTGVSFNFRKDIPNHPSDGKPQIGLIAQDVEKVYPELVSEDIKTGYKSVAYTGLIPVVIEAVKDQQNELDQIKDQLQNIKLNEDGRIDTLEEKVNTHDQEIKDLKEEIKTLKEEIQKIKNN